MREKISMLKKRHGGARLPKAIVEKKDVGILIFAYFGHFLIHKNIFLPFSVMYQSKSIRLRQVFQETIYCHILKPIQWYSSRFYSIDLILKIRIVYFQVCSVVQFQYMSTKLPKLNILPKLFRFWDGDRKTSISMVDQNFNIWH